MEEGIVKGSVNEEETAEFLINNGYPNNVIPVAYVLSGSRGYGLNIGKSDYDYVGLHFMDTWECLEHPNYRTSLPVLRKKFDLNLEEIPPGEKGGEISLDSFEAWKFIDLLQKGSFVVYEILYMPPIHLDPGAHYLLELFRAGLTNRIGKAAKGNALHDWRKDRGNRKKAVMAYFRLMQAIFFLREQEFEWRIDSLLEYAEKFTTVGKGIITTYGNPTTRTQPLTEDELNSAPYEIERLITEADRAMMITKLPDICPRKVLEEILQVVKRTRSAMI